MTETLHEIRIHTDRENAPRMKVYCRNKKAKFVYLTDDLNNSIVYMSKFSHGTLDKCIKKAHNMISDMKDVEVTHVCITTRKPSSDVLLYRYTMSIEIDNIGDYHKLQSIVDSHDAIMYLDMVSSMLEVDVIISDEKSLDSVTKKKDNVMSEIKKHFDCHREMRLDMVVHDDNLR